MKSTVLNEIVASKSEDLGPQKERLSLAKIKENLSLSQRSFYAGLKSSRPAFILECKRASPSKGVIREDFPLEMIAGIYDRYANAISVLTEERYFHGSYEYLKQVSDISSKPVLCKDFIIDVYQIYAARYYGADAVLLMLSILDDDQYETFQTVAHELNMGVLTEVSNEEELARALSLNARVIGINNRDLRDLSINLDKTKAFSPKIPEDRIVISESGILNHSHIQALSPYADGFLIGSALMAHDDLELAVRTMIYGCHKICGLTRIEDAQVVYDAGLSFGGMIFAKNSPRRITPEMARALKEAVPLCYVGVFQDEEISRVLKIAEELSLYAIQLHGEESQEYIDQLRAQLSEQIQIWKCIKVHQQLPKMAYTKVDRYLLDSNTGGSGIPFDWTVLEGKQLTQCMLAGGINQDNCLRALAYKPFGLDINSGIESDKGIKDSTLLQQIVTTIRKPLQKKG